MLNLIGVHECKMDAKGRISLPAALKKQLMPAMDDAFVLKRSVFNKCLELYPMQEWNGVMEKVNNLNRFVKKHNDFIRLFTAGVKLVELDGATRVGISPDLKSFANLSGHIVLSAHTGIVEIWDKDAYESAVNVDNDDFGLLAEEVMGGKNPSHNELS
ncbi:MAG TPA: division/cell wall cluster transcriptional repressor MraZ [Cryomorphaceae bacterium]|nr:division/cell wall cluster transcriptional repressor MraZ [Cryomorphaceae bacterium]HCY25733.1 division/cell wall cluster transcriptional repressor MraZ [Cryomorphaceae bacterium]